MHEMPLGSFARADVAVNRARSWAPPGDVASLAVGARDGTPHILGPQPLCAPRRVAGEGLWCPVCRLHIGSRTACCRLTLADEGAQVKGYLTGLTTGPV